MSIGEVCQENSIHQGAVDFKAATDVLTQRVTAEEIAAAAGVSVSSIARARLDPSSSAYRSPPAGWQQVLARLARERGTEFHDLAAKLENAGNADHRAGA